MKRLQKRLNPVEAQLIGRSVKEKKDNRNPRYRMSEEEWQRILEFRQGSETITIVDPIPQEEIPTNRFWAWNKHGEFMNITEMCKYYNLPLDDVHSYKIVSHTGTPYYNILFKENVLEREEIDFEEIARKYSKPQKKVKTKALNSDTFDRLVFTDVHIGMNPNMENSAMYDNKWDRPQIKASVNRIVCEILSRKQSDILVVEQLGDLVDGYNAKTTRGGHDLPQNMNNKEQFDEGVRFLVEIVDNIATEYKEVHWHNVCNDNHSGDFGYQVCQMFKAITELKWSNVQVINHEQFISHYIINSSVSLISHGKDKVHNKFGFKPILDTKQIEKIDQYIKSKELYKYPFIRFAKGDSHQAIFDDTTSNDFTYNSYPALSPASEWVQTNFKNSKRGFAFEVEDMGSGIVTRSMIYLK